MTRMIFVVVAWASNSCDWLANHQSCVLGLALSALLMNFLTIHDDIFRSTNADSHFVSLYCHDHYMNVAANDDLFPNLACQNQHMNLLPTPSFRWMCARDYRER
jgi:hypothetical protein